MALERALRIGDEATEGRTLTELYAKMGSQPFAVDLSYLLEQLGVRDNSPGVVLDPKAPWAPIREAICPTERREVKRHD
jgi:hypothetical protein